MTTYEYLPADKTYIHMATGSQTDSADLTAWDNGQAALVVGELNEMDVWRGGGYVETDPVYEPFFDTPDDFYRNQVLRGRTLGSLRGRFYFQTGILSYFTVQDCTTTEATPNTHTITADTTNLDEALIRAAFHIEKESPTGNIEKRADLMGMINPQLTISCSERQTIATQDFSANFAYVNTVAGDLGKTDTLGLTNYAPYTWFNLRNGGLTFTYGGTDVAFKIMGIQIRMRWNSYELDNLDSSAYPTDGRHIPPFIWEVILQGRSYDDAADQSLWGIKDESLTASAYSGGDLDFEADFKISATHYCKFTFDKCYLDPNFEVQVQGDNSWYTGHQIRLLPIGSSSSLTIEEKNGLNNDYYENPA